MQHLDSIIEQIAIATESEFTLTGIQRLTGGDINTAIHLKGKPRDYFVKLNRVSLIDMFVAESKGLEAIAQANAVRVPKPIVYGCTAENAFLVLEYLKFGPGSDSAARLLGEQLAELHRQAQPFFGWHSDNTLGSTKQPNAPDDNWLSFWREQRLGWQLRLAARHGFQGKLQALGEQLLADLPLFFSTYSPQPSLIHGDLWGGNAAVDMAGNPVIFDPACYYGDREADVAMTELFGGFSPAFYQAYNATWPLESGFHTRKRLYNLYHILNHLNLFGNGYLSQAENMLAGLLAEIR